jgi:hypothetical protein
MNKNKPRAVLEAIDASPNTEDELQRILGLSDEEVRHELTSAGADLGEVDAEADALYEKMRAAGAPKDSPGQEVTAAGGGEVPAVEAPVIPPRRAMTRRDRLICAAYGAAAAGALVALGAQAPAIVAHFRPKPPPEVHEEGPRKEPVVPPPLAPAEQLRKEAREACDAQDWGGCAKKLLQARKADPASDEAPEVKALWKRVREAMRDDGKDEKGR